MRVWIVIVALAGGVSSALYSAAGAQDSPEASRALREAYEVYALDTGPVAFNSEDGRRSFVLDRSGPAALLQFTGSREVWALTQTVAPRGDTIFRNDVGHEMLRLTSVGGAVFYPPERALGAPASPVGPGEAIPPLAATTTDPPGAADALTRNVTILGGPAIAVDVGAFVPDALAADTLDNIVTAIRRLGLERGRSDPMDGAQIAAIEIRAGDATGVRLVGQTVAVSVRPSAGYAGRPSSLAVAEALRAAF